MPFLNLFGERVPSPDPPKKRGAEGAPKQQKRAPKKQRDKARGKKAEPEDDLDAALAEIVGAGRGR